MGIYVNPGKGRFIEAISSDIYVDKTELIKYTNSVLGTQQKYICVSRPRRFGKSMTAAMLCAYYDRSVDSKDEFRKYKIYSQDEAYDNEKYINQYDVISINVQDFLSGTSSVAGMLKELNESLSWELVRLCNDVEFYNDKNIVRVMQDIYAQTGRKFVIIIDEWDCVFRERKNEPDDQIMYLDFLREWLKDKVYVALAYMTGILPIKKYGTQSALNMFDEYSMENPGVLAKYVGFTEEEVEKLCAEHGMDFDECKSWYDGYSFPKCKSSYNPKSVVSMIRSGEFHDYWNQTENYEALRTFIDMNYDGVRESIIAMMANEEVSVNVGSFQNDMTSFTNADDVLTLLIHLGYLGYNSDKKTVFIPNREIMQEFVTSTTAGEKAWDEVIKSVKESKELLDATLNGNEETVAEYIEKAHLETSHLQYNDENALSYTISLAYFAARQDYSIIREFPTGKGFADLTFIPKRSSKPNLPGIIVELKWDKSADTAIQQIRNKKYVGKLKDFVGDVILVGINYDKSSKEHQCKIERASQI
nr:AAA family ATPase [uncultured Butyrivibrio sp.]